MWFPLKCTFSILISKTLCDSLIGNFIFAYIYACLVIYVHMPKARAQPVSFLMKHTDTMFLEAGSLTDLELINVTWLAS